MISKAWLWASIVVAFLGGVLIATRPSFDVVPAITSGDVFEALTTIVVALVLGAIFERSFSEDRGEKDLLMEHIREVKNAARIARTASLAAYTAPAAKGDAQQILAALRNLSSDFSVLEEVCSQCKKDYKSPLLMKARNDVRKIRKALTETIPKEGETYSQDAYMKAETAFSALAQKLLLCSIDVNRR